jgi:uncharacterized membrane protein
MDQRIDLAPNCSLSDAAANWHYASICVLTLPLPVLFAWAGYWPVLLFWMVEMLGLGLALYLSLRRRRLSQTVLITEGRVQLVTRSVHGEVMQEFARHWARVRLRSPRTRHGSSLLTIESHGRTCVIGSFLTDEERARLAARLRAMVGGRDFTEGT